MDNKMSVPENATLVERLPPLPEPDKEFFVDDADLSTDYYTAEQMREYAAAALRATGEGEWVMVPKDALLAKIREGLGVDGTIYRDVEALLAAAPPPPLRDAPTNPGEISSKVVEPLRDAGAVDRG